DKSGPDFVRHPLHPLQHPAYSGTPSPERAEAQGLNRNLLKENLAGRRDLETVGDKIPPKQGVRADVPGCNKYRGGDFKFFEHRKGIRVIVAVSVVERDYEGTRGQTDSAAFDVIQVAKGNDIEVSPDETHLVAEGFTGRADNSIVEYEIRTDRTPFSA